MPSTSKKKVVLMVPQLRRGGAERVVSRLSFLLRDAYDVVIVVFDDSKISYDYGCELVTLDVKPNSKNGIFKKSLNVIKRVYLYNKFKRQQNIDITYSFGDTANIINVMSFGKDKRVISLRGFKRVRIGNGLKNKLFYKQISKLICKRSDLIVCVSELMSKTLSREYNISEFKIETSYNGYDFENIVKLSQDELSSEEENMNFNSDKIIITAGTFRSPKGYWHLIKAFSLVLQKEKNVKLLILGEDDDQNKLKVEKLANQLNISNKIIYGGYQSNPFKYFSKSTMYVLSSTSEGFPNAMVEAMICGLPIVASDCKSGPREILAPNTDILSTTDSIELSQFGVLVKEMNPKENYNHEIIEECDRYLAEGMLTILENDKLRLEYADKSRQRARDFGYEAWLKKQLEIIS
jgi:glycosyltransferase involved in cell wall biosynthesis